MNIIFGAMYDENKSDSCTVTVIATGLEEAGNTMQAQSRFGTGSIYRQQNKGMNTPPVQTSPVQQGSVQGIQKPVDIRSSVEEKTLKIPDFLQRK